MHVMKKLGNVSHGIDYKLHTLEAKIQIHHQRWFKKQNFILLVSIMWTMDNYPACRSKKSIRFSKM